MVRPSGDHCGLPAPRGMSVMARASPPSIASTWSLRRLRSAVLLDGAHERDPPSVRRPARPGVASADGQLARRLRAVGARDPEAGVVLILLLVHGDTDEDDLGAVGGDLRVGHPDELEQVLLGDVPLLCESRGGSEREQGNAGG